jgi:hypothetical protein
MIKIIVVFLSIFAIFIMADSAEAVLSCSITSGSCPGTTIFKMYFTSNSQAELPGQANYNYYVCCSGVSGLGNSCSGEYAVVLKLSSATNAQVEENTGTFYSNSVCLSASSDNNVSCVYSATSCPTDYVCLASISGGTNAHVGDCSAYTSRKVCCAVNAPPVFDFSISTDPISGSVSQGGSASTTVNTTLISGATQAVSFTVSGLPTSASASFNPASCSPSCSSWMNITIATSTPVGVYSIDVCGTTGSQSKCVTYGLTVIAAGSLGVTTNAANNITPNSMTLNGTLADMGNASSATVWFDWGTTTSYGNSTVPQVLNSPGAFSADLSSLNSSTTYYFKARAKNSSSW